MKVKARRTGYYGDRLIKKGQEFELNSPADLSDFKRRAAYGIGWMEVIEATTAELAVAAAAEKKRREGAQTIARAAVVVPPPDGVDRGVGDKKDASGRDLTKDGKPGGTPPAGNPGILTGTAADPKAGEGAAQGGTGSKDVLS